MDDVPFLIIRATVEEKNESLKLSSISICGAAATVAAAAGY